MYIVVVLMVSSLDIKFVNVYQKMQKVSAAAKKGLHLVLTYSCLP